MTQRRTLQDTTTTMSPSEVLGTAKRFFARRSTIYAAFIERETPSYVALRGQGSEEVIIAVRAADGVTVVTGSSYLFDAQISRFFATLPPVPNAVPVLSASAAPAIAAGSAP